VVFLEPNKKNIETYAKMIDGLLIPGNSNDINPKEYGEKPIMALPIEKHRVNFEFALIHKLKAQRKPILGICGGMQSINVAFGGSLYQDLPSQKIDSKINHNTKDGTIVAHDIEIDQSAEALFGKNVKRFAVNSIHHQAVKELGDGLFAFAKSDDGAIEGIMSKNHPFLVGIQWHPEFQLSKYDVSLIKSFCNAVEGKDDSKRHIKAELVK
jgi:putative glutamine amidotransferase